MPVLIDEDLALEENGQVRPAYIANRWLRELPVSGAPAPRTWREALKTEFEQRRDRLRESGEIADPREAQIERQMRGYVGIGVTLVAVGVFLFILAFPQQPWLPTEIITRPGYGKQTVVVLAVDDKSASVLHYKGGPDLVLLESISDRKYCRLPPSEIKLPYLKEGVRTSFGTMQPAHLPECPLK